jgi:predicted XRE-type DNA-binding protein
LKGDKEMKKQTFKSVWDAIEDSEEEATNMKIRSELMSALAEELKRRMLSQTETAELLGIRLGIKTAAISKKTLSRRAKRAA